MSVLSVILDLLFPAKCVFCRKVLSGKERDICSDCAGKLPFTEGQHTLVKGEFFDVCAAPLYYRDLVRDSFLRFKFQDMTKYAACYGHIIAECVREQLNGKFDVITWVPISAKRQKDRGYDQSQLLAFAVALELDDVAIETIKKPVDVPAQSGLTDSSQRRANVMGAFEVVDPELIEGKRILLIDDIITSGATLSECARILLTAGAQSVVCAVLARAKDE